MTKRGNPPKIDETPPSGEIIDAPRPIAVIATVVWNYGGPTTHDNAWVIAWTRGEVLVIWRTEGMNYPQSVWIRAVQVRRR